MSNEPDPPDPAWPGQTWQPAELPAGLQPADRPVYGQAPDGARYGQPPPYGAPLYGSGSPLQYGGQQYPFGFPSGQVTYGYALPESDKSFVATWLLAWFLGNLGIDRFYLGKTGTGILKLITIGGIGIWALVDLILVLAGKTRDKNGLPLAGYEQNKKVAWIVTAVLVLLGSLSWRLQPHSFTVPNAAPASVVVVSEARTALV